VEQVDTVPLVIRGGAAMPAVGRWNAEYLKQRIGGVRLRHKLSRGHAHPDFTAPTIKEMFALGEGTFAELIDAMTIGPVGERARRLFTGDEEPLLRRRDGVTTVSELLRPLLDDIVVPERIPPEQLYTVWAWFSGAGVRTWLHYDNNGCHNLNAQITGRKRCWLYAPEHLARLAPFPLGGANPAHNCSAIDAENPPPGFADLPCWEATLEAGDLLFIPAWWFHTFVHLGELNSNVNFWWRPAQPPSNAVARRNDLLELAVRSGVDPRGADPAAALLRRLDELAVAGP
jgi:lysine-specific demethylase 8